jgi:hypothetical protein
MKQSRVMSLVESAVNILVGLGVAMLANAIILPWLGFDISFKQNLIFGVLMTVVSIVRSYALRRLFEALHIRRPLSPFMQAVIAERYEQIEYHGYSIGDDDQLKEGVLSQVAVDYATDWQDNDASAARRKLIKSGALIMAEGERFDRQRKSSRRTLVPSSASEPSMKGRG